MTRKLTISFDMDNAAFDGDWKFEAARILHQAAYSLTDNPFFTLLSKIPIQDVNGNRIGYLTLEGLYE